MDAFPGYTFFDKTKKVLCVMQVLEDAEDAQADLKTVMGHTDTEKYTVDYDSDGNEVDTDSVPFATA